MFEAEVPVEVRGVVFVDDEAGHLRTGECILMDGQPRQYQAPRLLVELMNPPEREIDNNS